MENPHFDIQFEGGKITSATHLYSGTRIKTDAPLDNNGTATSFSPTDLVSSALVSCMVSIFAIHLEKQNQILKPVKALAKKIMASDPRRIKEIHIEFDFGENDFDADLLERFERLAHACPVAKSLSNEIAVITNFAELIQAAKA